VSTYDDHVRQVVIHMSLQGQVRHFLNPMSRVGFNGIVAHLAVEEGADISNVLVAMRFQHLAQMFAKAIAIRRVLTPDDGRA